MSKHVVHIIGLNIRIEENRRVEEQTPLPQYLKPWHKQLKALGVTEAKDMVFLTRKTIQKMKPPMPEVVIQKALADAINEQTDQGFWAQRGGITEGNELFMSLSKEAQKRVSITSMNSPAKTSTKVKPALDGGASL